MIFMGKLCEYLKYLNVNLAFRDYDLRCIVLRFIKLLPESLNTLLHLEQLNGFSPIWSDYLSFCSEFLGFLSA